MSATTDPGSKSPVEIERELDEERRRLSATADELSDRLSVGSLVDEVMGRFQGTGGEFGRNLGRTVRDNPLPVTLIGVGLAWLMAGGQDATDHRRGALGRFRSEGGYDDDDHGGYASMSGYRSRHLGRADGEVSGISRSGAHYDGDDHRDDGPGIGERVSGAASSVADAAGDAAGYVGDNARAARRSISQTADEAYWRARHHGRRAGAGFEDMLENHPLVAGALAFALGAAVGGLAPNTRAEDRLMGEQAERLRRDAGEALSDEVEKARTVAGAAVDEAGRMVDEAAGRADRETPDGRSIVEKTEAKAREAGERIGRAAEEEAKRQDLGSSVDTSRA